MRRVEAKFRKPANGSIVSTASATPEALARLDVELSSKSRSMISITVEIYDESNAHTLSATFELFIQREKKNLTAFRPYRDFSIYVRWSECLFSSVV